MLIIGTFVALMIMILASAFFFQNKKTDNSSPKTITGKTTGQKFQDSPDAAFAYKIIPDPLSQQTKQALEGFDFQSKDLADGSIELNLSPLKYGYKPQKTIVKKGYMLYFIETSDNDNFDAALGDDRIVLVDPNGYIIQ